MNESTPPELLQQESTLAELLQRRIALTPSAEAYRQFDPALGGWVSYSWGDFGSRVGDFRRALAGEALLAGARIAILIPNSIEHLAMDQAALALGLVPVPLHVIDNPESLAYVLADSGASLLFIDSTERWRLLEPFRARFPALQRVVHLGGSATDGGIARSLTQWLASAPQGTGGARTEPEPSAAPSPDALAAIVYTSGTTGRPKGVMLSHRNVVSNVHSIMAAVPVLQSDVFLSFLPLSHTLERTAGYYLPIAAGASVAFARSVSRLMEDFGAVRPTVLISVPRIYERVYAAIRESIEHRSAGRALFALAVRAGWARFTRSQGGEVRSPLALRFFAPWLDRQVGMRVRERFGGRLRAAVTGGAPLPFEVARTFLALGVPVLQGYGLTESAPVVACNTLMDNHPESVGRPLPGVEVRIGANGELLVRGPNVMRGYWGREEETAQAIDADAWLHTGDQAQIVDGRILIKGRIKDIIVTSTGEKIAPVDLETAILADPAFEQVIVVGEGRPYIAALCVLHRARWEEEAPKLGLVATDPASLRSRAAREWALARIAEAVRGLPAYATPRAVSLTTEPWTIDAGLLTPTLKPKRPALEARFAEEIAGLYRGHEAVT
jgi:long-chain acyl-CoA synthetase